MKLKCILRIKTGSWLKTGNSLEWSFTNYRYFFQISENWKISKPICITKFKYWFPSTHSDSRHKKSMVIFLSWRPWPKGNSNNQPADARSIWYSLPSSLFRRSRHSLHASRVVFAVKYRVICTWHARSLCSASQKPLGEPVFFLVRLW